ncbi:MAG: Asp-tRNA(Asn)/Glu-tRNA(Gln) amidotransferase subunit GatC [Lentisphaerae bacterium]|nr:Asp-tRNA(Asn)/Glu-tRNA(Gln) amidotransferase subunit GatC [Lentisphaerota bacterium]
MNEEKRGDCSRIDVEYVARLARLDLEPREAELFQRQLTQIVEYIRALQGVDVEGVEPMAHAVAVENVFRGDVPRDGLDRDAVLANAPEQDGEHFRVPLIVG